MTAQPSNFSPGKVIISGEHSVIYGQPAIVGGISLGIQTQAREVDQELIDRSDKYLQYIFDIFIDYLTNRGQVSFSIPPIRRRLPLHFPDLQVLVDSSLPQKSGLGSSAAFAHAVFLGLADFFKIVINDREMFELVWTAEKYIHHDSSGIDPAAVVYGGLIHFEKNTIKNLEPGPIFETDFVLVHSGPAEETTGEMVQQVKQVPQSRRDKIVKSLGRVTRQLSQQLSTGFFDYSLLSENQSLLEKLGVVGAKAKQIVRQIEEFDGVAKVTGAGGVKAGSGYLLCWHRNIEALVDFIQGQSWDYQHLKIGAQFS